ncbi:ATP-dependent nuclease [Nodularia sp. NIES-3585]|uniref:ATP-dependent nuclease n=1 Tax=Nodularia sp. NIES-3585 TaxID=1973477 RepID=UPI0020CE7904|nr:DUF2813 domain-containing protein [Nodularia sp. NIES-3585]
MVCRPVRSRTQVLLTSKAGAKLPIGRHGEGTQSLAVMLLFDAFLQHQLENEYDASTEPILALEEPEAHLHPSAVRSVAKLLQELKGQKIIATHSRDLISSVELHSLRRLCRKDGVIKVFQLEPGVLTEDELNKLNYCVRATRADLLLARCWLMVEGATEYIVFNESARILGIDLYAEGICCVEYAQSSPDALLKFANAMGIDWHFLADGDTEGINYLKKAEEHLMGRSKDMHLSKLEDENMEIFLCINDYGHVFENNISPQKRDRINCCKGTKEYWQQVVKARTQIFTKTRAAITVMQEIENQGANALPQQIKTIIENVRDIARQAG